MKISWDSFFPDLTQATLDGLDKYYDTMEVQLQTVEGFEREKLKAKIKEFGLEHEDEWVEWDLAMQEHRPVHEMMFPNFLRFSFIILSFLILEDSLRELCSIVGKKMKRKPPQPRGNILKEYKAFLMDSGVDIPERYWNEIFDINKVRNCIVHRSGNVKDYKYEKHLRNLATKVNGLEISSYEYNGESSPWYYEENTLIVDPKFCKHVVDAIRDLFEKLCQAVPLHGLIVIHD